MDDAHATEDVSVGELREASFPQALRGYDREAVHALLDRVADWVEGKTEATSPSMPQVKTELEKVGERTAGILTAAEEAAGKLRAEAQKLREGAGEEARKLRLNASQRADELIAEAEAKAEKIIDDAITRRRRLNQAITSLAVRRDEIAEEAQRLADQLLEAVEAFRADEGIEEIEDEAPDETGDVRPIDADEAERARQIRAGFLPGGPPPGVEPTELEPPDQRETTVHETDRS